jgi:hypothetical protein
LRFEAAVEQGPKVGAGAQACRDQVAALHQRLRRCCLDLEASRALQQPGRGLLQEARTRDSWEDWVAYMIDGVEATAREGVETIRAIRNALEDARVAIRKDYRFYSQDLVNNLFSHPYTKVQFVERDLGVSHLTATKYLDALADGGHLRKQKAGRTNVYVNTALFNILTGKSTQTVS